VGIFQARRDLQELEKALGDAPQRAAKTLSRIVAAYVAGDDAKQRVSKAA
jgi:hypothetical protein